MRARFGPPKWVRILAVCGSKAPRTFQSLARLMRRICPRGDLSMGNRAKDYREVLPRLFSNSVSRLATLALLNKASSVYGAETLAR